MPSFAMIKLAVGLVVLLAVFSSGYQAAVWRQNTKELGWAEDKIEQAKRDLSSFIQLAERLAEERQELEDQNKVNLDEVKRYVQTHDTCTLSASDIKLLNSTTKYYNPN